MYRTPCLHTTHWGLTDTETMESSIKNYRRQNVTMLTKQQDLWQCSRLLIACRWASPAGSGHDTHITDTHYLLLDTMHHTQHSRRAHQVTVRGQVVQEQCQDHCLSGRFG